MPQCYTASAVIFDAIGRVWLRYASALPFDGVTGLCTPTASSSWRITRPATWCRILPHIMNFFLRTHVRHKQ